MQGSTFRWSRFIFHCIAILVIAVLCFTLWYLRAHYRGGPERYTYLFSETGEWDLTDVDFEKKTIRIEGNVPYIPDALLTPQAFDEYSESIVYGQANDSAVHTARLYLRFPDDGIYMLMMKSVDFAERIYINGELRQEVGIPGLTAEETTEGFAHLYFEVRPIGGWVEIVRQSANFVHRENGSSDDITIGRPEYIKRQLSMQTDLAGLSMGLFFALAIAHGMLFGLLRGYRANLYAAMLCLAAGLRTGVTDFKVIAAWFPTIPWEVLFRLEYLTIPAMSLMILLVVRELFPGARLKWFTRIMGGFFALLGLLCLVLPTRPLSYCAVIMQAGMMACALFLSIYLSIRMPRLRRDDTLREAQWVSLVGLWFLAIAVINDALYYNNIYLFKFYSVLNDVTMMILAFLLMGAVFSATLRQAAEARAREARIADEKKTLEALSRRKSAFYTDISHELKTPLTVIAANAQFAAQNIRAGRIDEETGVDLDAISAEAKRLAQMVTGLVSLGRMQEGHGERAGMALDQIVADTARMYAALTGKRGNTATTAIEAGLPPVAGNADELSQVLINLLQNADRHTAGGQITVAVHREGDMARVTVTDTGEGIAETLLPTVFDRFVRGGPEGTGLGLPISKAIIEAHGGSMGIESQPGGGTKVWFDLPLTGGEPHG